MPFVHEDAILYRCEGCVEKWCRTWYNLPSTPPSNMKQCDICNEYDVILYKTVGGGWN